MHNNNINNKQHYPTESKPNFSISAYRVLFILKLLVEEKALSFHELNERLSENPAINRGFNGETITKYMNTLRHLGCAIPKANIQQNYQYRLIQTPFSFQTSDEEIAVLNRLLEILTLEADDEYYKAYQKLLQKISWSIADNEKLDQLLNVNLNNPDDQLIEKRKKLSYYRQLCQDGQALELTYTYTDGQETTLIIEPKRITEINQIFYLLATDRKAYQKVKLNINAISKIKQLPFKVKPANRKTNVIFELNGKLAQNYRLYPDEIYKEHTDNRAEVKASIHDTEVFLNRLLKYGQKCQIISPEHLRQEMQEKIEKLITHLSY